MLNINFIPAEDRKALHWDAWRRLVLALAPGIFAGFVVVFLVLHLLNIYLVRNLDQETASLNRGRQIPPGSEVVKIEGRLRTVNDKLTQMADIWTKTVPKAPLLAEVASLVPAGVEVRYLKIDNEGMAELKGLAQDRKTLLQFKAAIEDDKNISGLDFPLTNLMTESDIEFVLSFQVALRGGPGAAEEQ